MDGYYLRHYYQERWSDEDGLWQQNTLMHQRYTFPTLRRLCGRAMDRPRRILEIGCGYGTMLGALAAAVVGMLGLINTFGSHMFVSQAIQLPEGEAPDWQPSRPVGMSVSSDRLR